jgi:hypothetical protein
MANFLGTTLGLFLTVVVVAFVVANYLRVPVYAPPMRGAGGAVLPCLANGRCPGGQVCAGGVCVERFMDVPSGIKDMASCTAPQCQGIDQPCARGSPCAEGSFCQKNQCVKIEAPDQGEAMGQIGMISLN